MSQKDTVSAWVKDYKAFYRVVFITLALMIKDVSSSLVPHSA